MLLSNLIGQYWRYRCTSAICIRVYSMSNKLWLSHIVQAAILLLTKRHVLLCNYNIHAYYYCELWQLLFMARSSFHLALYENDFLQLSSSWCIWYACLNLLLQRTQTFLRSSLHSWLAIRTTYKMHCLEFCFRRRWSPSWLTVSSRCCSLVRAVVSSDRLSREVVPMPHHIPIWIS